MDQNQGIAPLQRPNSRLAHTRNPSREDRKIARHPEFYFLDGSVVLIVETTAFRVHQSVLARHSETFNDLWQVPQPPNGGEQYDGCPAVYLTDSASDFVDVMRVIYDTFHFDKLKADDTLLAMITFVSGILRISTKYHMHNLRNKCIGIIQEKFPSTLAGCDAVLSKEIRYNPSEIVRIIPIARETNVPKVLPWAFYLCAHINVDEILANQVLSWRDKALCLAGKEKLWEAQKKHTHSFMFEYMSSQYCNGGCLMRAPKSLDWRDSEALRMAPHPLEEYTDWKAFKVCSKCLDSMSASHATGRQLVWNALPTYFQLGTWEQICSDQSA